MPKNQNHLIANSDAVFIGWLHHRSGDSIALYNITVTNHPSFGSTVTAKTLRKLNLDVPPTPPAQEDVKRFQERFRGTEIGVQG